MLDCYATLKGWTAEITVLPLPLFLADSALCWYQELPTEMHKDLETILANFVREFQLSPAQIFALLAKLQQMKQQQNQCVSILAVSTECKILGIGRTGDAAHARPATVHST